MSGHNYSDEMGTLPITLRGRLGGAPCPVHSQLAQRQELPSCGTGAQSGQATSLGPAGQTQPGPETGDQEAFPLPV